MKEEIQKIFASSQETIAKTHKVKEECSKMMKGREIGALAAAISQEKFVLSFLKGL